MSIYDKLNEPQREAVYHTDGPLLSWRVQVRERPGY